MARWLAPLALPLDVESLLAVCNPGRRAWCGFTGHPDDSCDWLGIRIRGNTFRELLGNPGRSGPNAQPHWHRLGTGGSVVRHSRAISAPAQLARGAGRLVDTRT